MKYLQISTVYHLFFRQVRFGRFFQKHSKVILKHFYYGPDALFDDNISLFVMPDKMVICQAKAKQTDYLTEVPI